MDGEAREEGGLDEKEGEGMDPMPFGILMLEEISESRRSGEMKTRIVGKCEVTKAED